MPVVGTLKRWFARPPVTGRWAIGATVAAVAAPTFIRCLVDSAISGVALSPYLPFVLMAALLIGWRPAVATALASAAVADMLFIDPRYVPMAGPTDLFAIAVFLVCAALIIVIVQSARVIVENCPGPLPREEKATGVIFSLEKGQAWASWSGAGNLRLGPESEVATMMQDFLAQLEVGKRLVGQAK